MQNIKNRKRKIIIEKYRKDPVLAAEQLLGIKLKWYQKNIFNSFYLKFINGSKIKIPIYFRKRNSDKLTKKQFLEMIKHFEKPNKQSKYFIASSKQREKIWYYYNSIIIAKYPGYRKWQGPDGKTWFEKIINYEHFGSGNKTRRRLGYSYDNLSGEWYK
jgi:hypothetical protein